MTKKGYIPKAERKTILFLADDCRLPSGIGTMTREIIVGNAHAYNFVHVGAAINHPDIGKIYDLSAEINKEVGIEDSSVLLYPYNGYGDPDLVRMLIERHKVDGIVHFTDPRYWVWLYRMSAEVRQNVPIFYYHIWDDLPAPHYNKNYYQSCDLLMGISKQSDNIAKLVLGKGNFVELDVSTTDEAISKQLPKTCYIPHGINTKYFFPVDRQDEQVQKMRKQLFSDINPEFVLLYNNRNIRRKMTSDAILAFKLFHDQLTPDQQHKVRFVLHTQPIDENGTDLPAVIEALCPDIADKIVFTNARFTPVDMNLLYSACDAVINIASNEGWGLSSTEAMMCGVPIINNVTGGLQDQLRFEDENGDWINFNEDFATNHAGKYKKHGVWGIPVFPAAINLQGSIPTPYIFDDRADVRDVARAIMYWYNIPEQQRKAAGAAGREWATSEEAGMTAEHMCDRFRFAVDKVLSNWVAPDRFKLYNVRNEVEKYKHKLTGITL
jgi:glycosyltransferase involved in cell wall biosynthesis